MGAWAKRTFDKLTVEEKVGQTICYRATEHADATLDMARKGLVGSVSPIYYKGMRDRDAAIAFMNALNAASPVPVFFISSHANAHPAWGAAPCPDEGSSMALAATRNPDLARRCALAASVESKAIGFDIVWTPVVDVNTNPRNPIIGTRAFSDRPDLVAEMGLAVVRGMQEARLIPNAKHFPGHGDTGFDTHRKIGVVPHGRERLDAVELYPYRKLIQEADLRGVETAHIVYPALDDTPGLPATFSRKCIYDLLRTEMGFTGLIVSDSLTMKAIKDHWPVAESLVLCFNSGHDLILQDYNEPPMPSFEAMLSAVRDGRIRMADLDESVMRLLEAKEWCGLHERGPVTREEIDAVFNCPEHAAVAREAWEASLTVLENGSLPLNPAAAGKVCAIATRAEEEGKGVTDFALTVENSRDRFFAGLRARLGDVATHVLDEDPDASAVDAAVAAAEGCDTVVFATMPRIVCYKELSGRVGAGQVALVQRLLDAGKRVNLCVFGTPYAIADFPRTQGCLTTYSSSGGAVDAGVRRLFGDIESRGKLPVTLSERYGFGYGL